MDPKLAKTTETTEEVKEVEGTTQDTSTPEEDTTLGEEEDFSYLADEDVDDVALTEEKGEGEEEEGEAAPAEPPAKSEAAEEPKEEQQAEPEKPAEKETQKEQPAQPAEPEPSPKPEPQDLETQFQAFFDKGVEALTPVYKLSPEEAEALDTTPSEAIPKLAARLHMQVLTAAATQTARMMPQMMEHFGNQRKDWDSAEEQFYEKYPALKKPEYGETVERIAWAYRQQNPKASPEQTMDEVAAMAMVTLQLPFEQLPSSQQETQVDTPPPAPGSARGAGATSRTQTKTEWDELLAIEE